MLIKNSTVFEVTVLFVNWKVLLPAESLAQDPERYCNGNEEQAQTNWTTPAEPRTPRAPVLQMVLVAPVVVLFKVLGTFALVWHIRPLVN